MDNNVHVVCKHLKQEIIWVEELNALLAEEKSYLEQCLFNKLEECASKKQDLSKKLEESARERMTLINSSGLPAENALQDLLKDSTAVEVSEVHALNKKLSESLQQCRELNSVNGQVIANNLYVRQEMVNALTGNNADAVSVYNSHGNLTSSNDKRHHQEA